MIVVRQESKAVAFSQRVYRLLLAAYPRAHRQEYGGPMVQLFRDQCRDAWKRRRIWGVIWLWLRVLPELLKTAIWERLTDRRERKNMAGKDIVGAPPVLGTPISNWIAILYYGIRISLLTGSCQCYYIYAILPEAYSKARIKKWNLPLLRRRWLETTA